ncbi:immunoglobulin-binding protein 1b [Parasteatoda tepidariorum]|uniref:immunoglobulin-binding protein 1b n=1 Tax=Parasteatoda tepidariorum TaxID=114398 RepID=UPI001C71A900|nr:immunoglobulin-binding protein 1b [Parasteatoda tepidariorum]
MTESELIISKNNLMRYFSKAADENNSFELKEIFDDCLKLLKLIENTSLSSNDKSLQEAISSCVKSLEKCTKIVNHLDLFSSNETIEEVQTSSLKYLILPACLGSLTLSLATKEFAERVENLRIAEVYFKDFLLRCKNYELNVSSLKQFNDELENSEAPIQVDPSTIRQNKIQQYKLKKELEEKEKNLSKYLEREDCEEYIREYYFVLLERWIMIALEELENIKKEKDVLKSMPGRGNSTDFNKRPPQDIRPLKPLIITKNEIQKKVFGLGYPAIPVMTIDDFYYQRFHNQIKNRPTGMSLQEKALRGEELDKDSEEIEKEKQLDKDDPIALMKARQWDDWKDDNPRGSGNRHNKG